MASINVYVSIRLWISQKSGYKTFATKIKKKRQFLLMPLEPGISAGVGHIALATNFLVTELRCIKYTPTTKGDF